MSARERRSEWLVLLGVGLVLWGGWQLLTGLFGTLPYPFSLVAKVISAMAWPLAIIALGVLLIVVARGGVRPNLKGRRLYRSRDHRMVGGILGGVAEYLGVAPIIIRIAFVALSLVISVVPAVLLYIIAMLVIPEEPTETEGSWRPTPPPAPPVPGSPTTPSRRHAACAATSRHPHRPSRRRHRPTPT